MKFFENIIEPKLSKKFKMVRGDYFLQEIKELSASGEEDLLSVSEYTGVTLRKNSVAEGDYLSRAENLEGYRIVRKGNLVMNYMLAWKGAQGVSSYEGITSPAYSVFNIDSKKANERFVHHMFRSDVFKAYFRSESSGIIESRLRFYPDSLRCLKIGLPSLELQNTISKYLDRETTRIDALVAKKTRFIELLREKRQALITHAVTKGLDPNVKMKDSGVEWLGEVPEHWMVRPIKYFAEVLRGKFTHRPRNDPNFYGGAYPFIQTGDITGTSKYIKTYSQTLNEKGVAVSKEFPKGTLVMAIAANIGDVAILDFDAFFPDSIVGLIPNKDNELLFLYYLMMAMKPAMLSTVTISTQMNLSIEKIVALIAAQPPLIEQVKIVNFIEKSIFRIDALTNRTTRSIELLKERRAALITAAVTGQIDLHEAA